MNSLFILRIAPLLALTGAAFKIIDHESIEILSEIKRSALCWFKFYLSDKLQYVNGGNVDSCK